MLENVLEQFGISGEPKQFGDGHINTTYRIGNSYVVQKLNTDVFTNPAGVMDNAFKVTEYIKNKLISMGEDPSRQTIEFLRTKNGESALLTLSWPPPHPGSDPQGARSARKSRRRTEL